MIRARLLAAGLAAAIAAPAAAADFELPKQLTWTAYGSSSSGYAQAVAIGAALQEAAGVNLRVLPGKNDIARMEPIRQRKVPFSAMGVGSYMTQEGVFEFGAKRWGPQKVRLLAINFAGNTGLAIGVAADSGIESYEDLRGKRVVYTKGSPALNTNTEAYLAYAGLTWDDVEVVEFGGYGDGWKGVVNGQADAAFAIMTSGSIRSLEASPRGLHWPAVDPTNTAGIERMQSVAPYFAPITATKGAVAEGKPEGIPSAAYPYPILIAYDDRDADLVYNMTKALHELHDKYKANAPGADGWAIGNQNFQWVMPYHEGAVRYYKEAGVWGADEDAHNAKLIDRQNVLAAAWAELEAEDPENWEEAWAEKRRAALKAAGHAVVF